MGRIVVLISGSGSNLQALIDAVQAGNIKGKIVGVFSDRADAYGLKRAELAGIPANVHAFGPFRARGQSRSEYDAVLANMVESLDPDLVVLAGFMRILSADFIDRFKDRLINLHPALPGVYPGTQAIKRAWLDAQGRVEPSVTGVMIHRVIEEVDAGAVLGIREVAINRGESLEDLTARMHDAEHELIVEVVAGLLADK